jgi:hypothetical protein
LLLFGWKLALGSLSDSSRRFLGTFIVPNIMSDDSSPPYSLTIITSLAFLLNLLWKAGIWMIYLVFGLFVGFTYNKDFIMADRSEEKCEGIGE